MRFTFFDTLLLTEVKKSGRVKMNYSEWHKTACSLPKYIDIFHFFFEYHFCTGLNKVKQ